jgi:hypothetical protein
MVLSLLTSPDGAIPKRCYVLNTKALFQNSGFISKRPLFSKQTLFGFIPAAAGFDTRNFPAL